MMDSCFSSICKFGTFKNPMITSLSELYFIFRRFCLLVQANKKISVSYGSSTCRWKPWRWVRFDLILMMRDIFMNSNLNPHTKFTSSSTTTEFNPIQDGFFRGCWQRGMGRGGGGAKSTPPPCLKSLTHILQWWNLAVIPYVMKIQKLYESRETTLEFCWHQHFIPESANFAISRNIGIDSI